MLLNLSDQSSESLQAQIVRQIRAKILAEDLPAGADLPSIRKLAREQHVSVITVQRAYEKLDRDGLIHSRRGKGFFVSELSPQSKKSLALMRLQESIEHHLRAALSEGLTHDDISRIVSTILQKGKTRKRN